ncbi:MAG: hypothetical protein HFI68_02160 [Lachnospiraceae bacterium]|nr:hypothetical protein [Lachnospiraceae bacterium]
MTEEKRKQTLKYILTGFGLFCALFLISSFGMWVVKVSMEYFDEKKYEGSVAAEEDTWQMVSFSEEENPLQADMDTDFADQQTQAILEDRATLNDYERLQVEAELSLKSEGSHYREYQVREPVTDLEITKEAANEFAKQFMERLNSMVADVGYLPYTMGDSVPVLMLWSDHIHPSVSLWVVDYTSEDCIVRLYLDAWTGLPIRFFADYIVGKGTSNATTLDAAATMIDWQTGIPSFVDNIFPYWSGFLKTEFLAEPVRRAEWRPYGESGEIYDPVSQWVTEDYQYVLSQAYCQDTQSGAYAVYSHSYFDIILSPMANQERVRDIMTDHYGKIIFTEEYSDY